MTKLITDMINDTINEGMEDNYPIPKDELLRQVEILELIQYKYPSPVIIRYMQNWCKKFKIKMKI